ncbi:MAG TPA: EAL domain-containing protein [Acidimicrobiales bacterium]|nr:EAL domain-containing protein [Acidimicrobiales bacterium]
MGGRPHIPDMVRALRARGRAVVVLPSLCTAGAFSVLAHFKLVGDLPLWALLLLLAGASAVALGCSRFVTRATPAPLLALAIGLEVTGVTVVIYAIGWGAALSVGYLFVAFRAVSEAGSRAWRMAVPWTLAGVAAGEVAVGAGAVHSYIANPYSHGLAALTALGTSVVIGLVGQHKAETEQIRAALEEEIAVRVGVDGELRKALSLLTATLDSTADGIVVVDSSARVTHFNAHVLEMWGLPEDVLDHGGAMALMMEQLVHPEQFAAKLEEVTASGDVESYDLLECKDGRVFERYSRPQRVDGDVVGRVWSFRDVTARTELEVKLKHQAFHDSLTGVANTTLFNDRLEHALRRAERTGGGMAVLFLDLDNFKVVNDSYGHAAGDTLLVHIGRTLTECVRSSDTVARLGGDEFAVLVEDLAEPGEAAALAERVMAAMRAPLTIAGNAVVATVSIGVACHERGWTSVDLLRNADLAMYTAKQLGKDRHVEYRGEMYRMIAERTALGNHLHDAVARELVVHYQPIIELPSGRLAGFEALVRWDHPERGLLLPDEFIPIAEEIGLVHEIDRHVLMAAASEVQSWGPAPYLITVNVSARRLLDPALTSDVATVLNDVLPASSTLVLEVTESAVLRDTDTAMEQLRAVRALGAKVALDDFGTGYSSLAHLRQLPIDIVKIDRTFVADLAPCPEGASQGAPHGAGDRGVANAILHLARSMGLEAIAEGVESVAHVAALERLGCTLAQGMHLGPPTDAAGARRLAAAGRPRARVSARS